MSSSTNKHTARTIAQHEYGLTFHEQEQIEKLFDKETILDITKKVFENEELSPRSPEFNNVKRFIQHLKRNVNVLEFTPEQLEFIQNNKGVMRPVDMAKALFGETKKPTPKNWALTGETKTISKYLESLGTVYGAGDDSEDEDLGTYKSPTSELKLVQKINQCGVEIKWNAKELSVEQKRCIDSLFNYLSSPFFVTSMSIVKQKTKRDLMESTLIQGTYDKPDLNSEELNMYINLCSDYVLINDIKEQMTEIHERIGEMVGDGEEQRRNQVAFANTYSAKVTEYHQCQQRIKNLQESLSDKRSNRLKSTAAVNQSLTKLVEEWKSEEGRKRALRIAEAKRLELKKEVDRIEDESEYIANVMGIGRDEILEL